MLESTSIYMVIKLIKSLLMRFNNQDESNNDEGFIEQVKIQQQTVIEALVFLNSVAIYCTNLNYSSFSPLFEDDCLIKLLKFENVVDENENFILINEKNENEEKKMKNKRENQDEVDNIDEGHIGNIIESNSESNSESGVESEDDIVEDCISEEEKEKEKEKINGSIKIEDNESKENENTKDKKKKNEKSNEKIDKAIKINNSIILTTIELIKSVVNDKKITDKIILNKDKMSLLSINLSKLLHSYLSNFTILQCLTLFTKVMSLITKIHHSHSSYLSYLFGLKEELKVHINEFLLFPLVLFMKKLLAFQFELALESFHDKIEKDKVNEIDLNNLANEIEITDNIALNEKRFTSLNETQKMDTLKSISEYHYKLINLIVAAYNNCSLQKMMLKNKAKLTGYIDTKRFTPTIPCEKYLLHFDFSTILLECLAILAECHDQNDLTGLDQTQKRLPQWDQAKFLIPDCCVKARNLKSSFESDINKNSNI
ncbi:hypothetical protein K502DRAFT_182505 [Neoconidiobolus thromboides FSU 785]|nr:hypothetical protein K502DRAFT_182505 [Neoconidiobolus thromboides FSU 785]